MERAWGGAFVRMAILTLMLKPFTRRRTRSRSNVPIVANPLVRMAVLNVILDHKKKKHIISKG